jgi:hypothetical protein
MDHFFFHIICHLFWFIIIIIITITIITITIITLLIRGGVTVRRIPSQQTITLADLRLQVLKIKMK